MTLAERQPPYGTDVSRESDFQRVVRSDARLREVEDFDDAISASRGEEGVGWVEGYGTYPA